MRENNYYKEKTIPIYEYKCECGTVTEKFLPVSRIADTVPCKVCESEASRTISKSTFQFKCGGFYHTDYVQQNTTAGSED